MTFQVLIYICKENKDMTNLTPFQQKFKSLCLRLGKSNNAVYGALTIAASKGILRPTFTMMDKKQEKKSRTYTAFREGLTGAVAFISYLITNAGVNKLAAKIAQKTNNLNKLPQMKATLSLISVSLTALFVIPGICNYATKPLLDEFQKHLHKKYTPTPKTKPDINQNIQPPAFTSLQYGRIYNNFNSGLRIGGGL